jgi:hypothetical protein
MSDQPKPLNVNSILAEGVLIAAHPDDEILWFSSIIEKVKQVVICYIGVPSRPDWASGRAQALADYPLDNLLTLDLDEADVFNCCDWQYPSITPFGLDVRGKGCSRNHYIENYHLLRRRLGELLQPHHHVFTHNPWGEYGNEEHVQVFRAIENLQSEIGFTLWVSNYVSNHSAPLMSTSLKTIRHRFFCERTNRALAEQIRDLYLKHGCWTWYPDFHWCHEEAFLQLNPFNQRKSSIGRSFPINFINVGRVSPFSPFTEKTDRLIGRVCRLRNRMLKRKKRY